MWPTTMGVASWARQGETAATACANKNARAKVQFFMVALLYSESVPSGQAIRPGGPGSGPGRETLADPSRLQT
jgi:hypothetical protein